MLPYSDTPVLTIEDPTLEKAAVRLLLKREDLNHPFISGNKWWKLKYNLQEAIRQGHDTLLTFGGAYSNHIYATAAGAKNVGLKSIGIIRGERTEPLNATLQFARDNGMQLHYVTRESYRKKDLPEFHQSLREKFGNFYLVPEGGTNELALKGCREFGALLNSIPADYVCLPVGTGGTMAGIIRGLATEKTVLGFAVLKNQGFLEQKIHECTGELSTCSWQIINDYAYGGYAKRHPAVASFIDSFLKRTNVPFDFVYTGKMMCGIFDLVEKGFFEKGTTILAIHTGGLQGHS